MLSKTHCNHNYLVISFPRDHLNQSCIIFQIINNHFAPKNNNNKQSYIHILLYEIWTSNRSINLSFSSTNFMLSNKKQACCSFLVGGKKKKKRKEKRKMASCVAPIGYQVGIILVPLILSLSIISICIWHYISSQHQITIPHQDFVSKSVHGPSNGLLKGKKKNNNMWWPRKKMGYCLIGSNNSNWLGKGAITVKKQKHHIIFQNRPQRRSLQDQHYLVQLCLSLSLSHLSLPLFSAKNDKSLL